MLVFPEWKVERVALRTEWGIVEVRIPIAASIAGSRSAIKRPNRTAASFDFVNTKKPLVSDLKYCRVSIHFSRFETKSRR
jgi:hypothetical protein